VAVEEGGFQLEGLTPEGVDDVHLILQHPDPVDVPCRAAGLDLQSRPTEYKDFQSAKAMN